MSDLLDLSRSLLSDLLCIILIYYTINMQPENKETGYRWVILLLYSLSLGCNAMLWITMSPITSVVAKVINIIDLWSRRYMGRNVLVSLYVLLHSCCFSF